VIYLKTLFLTTRFFLLLGGVSLAFVFGYFFPLILVAAEFLVVLAIVLFGADLALLYAPNRGISATRVAPQRLSNGDDNYIHLHVNSGYPIDIECMLVDEIPHQFQMRNFSIHSDFKTRAQKKFSYKLHPVNRGSFQFGNINLFVSSRLRLFRRRFIESAGIDIPVYPSFIQMRKFEMYAISNRLTDIGVKKIRRIGHTMEFDQIKEYVRGDDMRSINWKATARSNQLMVNHYQDERSQQVVNVIDLGRVMKMPFNGLQLLEYAINTSLVLSNISLLKEDKAGLFTFSNKATSIIKPEKKRTHIRRIQEALYNVETNFLESDYDRLLVALKKHLGQRSLLLLYTNFETLDSMHRQLHYLKRIAHDHLLVTIFFENTELNTLLEKDAQNVRDIYVKTVAEKFSFEKKQIVKELNQHGIHTILTPPKELSINAINKYLELKARALI
jgi:uncharacterized protein (DUF58 family)